MSWMQKLYETYENCIGRKDLGEDRPLPLGQISQQSHIEVTIDSKGNFIRAQVLSPYERIAIPATEASAGRSGDKGAPHPLIDKIQYCAGDYKQYGGLKKHYFSEYLEQLLEWSQSAYSHPKVVAIYEYSKSGKLVQDLIESEVLVLEKGEKWVLKKLGKSQPKINDYGDVFVRWIVSDSNTLEDKTWKDEELQSAWSDFDSAKEKATELCMILGEEVAFSNNHPSRIRHSADRAKIISSNDTSGYTFRGRFTTSKEACTVSFEATQKVHNALRWLIDRQSYRNDTQVFLAWEIGGKSLPDPWDNTYDFVEKSIDELTIDEEDEYSGDYGRDYALRLRKALYGYGKKIDDSNQIIIMGLDSATPGRLSIIYYQELTGSEFLYRIESWHSKAAWHLKYSKEVQFIGAPSPKDIADAVYGRRIDDKLRKTTIERLIPCVIQGKPVPLCLISTIVHRVCNRIGMEAWEWEKTLGIACSLIRHRSFSGKNEEVYSMGLDRERRTRDYLFGRLLAVADYLEMRAQKSAGEERSTNAARFMNRFSERPSSTWKSIDNALNPYKARLRARERGLLVNMEKELDEIMGLFIPEEFLLDSRLSSEFLLGYHCERQYLWKPKEKKEGYPSPEVVQEQENEEEI